MPKGKLTPQGDQRRQKPDVEPITRNINRLYKKSLKTLEAATLASQRQAAIDAATTAGTRDRFPSAVGDE
jgi:hypothetical protein